MNGSNSREYKDNIYVAPDGRKYKLVGISEGDAPEFGVSGDPANCPLFAIDDNGQFIYQNEDEDEEDGLQFLVDESNGNLYSEFAGAIITTKGILQYDVEEQDYGDLVYKYDEGKTEYQFTVDEDGNLVTEIENCYIDANGYIQFSTDIIEIIEPDVSDDILHYIRLVRQHNKQIRLKVTLLDENYREVENITGKIKGAPAYDIDSESDIRRTCSITLSIPAKEQMEIDFEKTWNNRMVELSCGIYGWEEKEYTWFDLGRMLMTNGSTVYNATTQEIKLNLVDLMASMTQERGNQIGVETLIPAESQTDGALIGIVTTYSNFKRNDVCSFEDTIPYDLKSNIGDYPIELVRNVLNLFPYYEFFYDSKGVFTVRQIPTKTSDPVDISATVLDDLIISEKKDIDFSVIKNTTELHGRELTGEYTATACVTSGDTYNVTISNTFSEPISGETFTVVPDSTSVSGQKMKIQETSAYPIVSEASDGVTYTPIAIGAMEAGVPYVLRYFEEKYILQGEFYIRCIVQEITEEPDSEAKEAYKAENNCPNVQWIVNPDSPFACTINPVTNHIQGEMRQVLSGGEYSNIYTTELAYERASYENWKSCRMQDTVDIDMILVPWMDVNDKIEYTSPVSGEIGTWLVKAISYDFNDWTMTVKASRFYPYYPFWE